MNERKTIDLEQGWEFMQKGITKLKNILEGLPEPLFSSEDYKMLYETIYNMCTQKPSHDYSQQLYEKYRESIEEYITSTVLPSIREKHDEFMLRELVKRWANHKVMVRWLSRFFHYLDRTFIPRRSLPPLNEVGMTCFRDLVYLELNGKVRDVVISLIDQEREGEQIDRALLKNVLDIFVEIGMGQMDHYENDFEDAMLKDTAAYYSRKASNWILEDSCPDYLLIAEECLTWEKDRVAHYLHSSSEPKLLEDHLRVQCWDQIYGPIPVEALGLAGIQPCLLEKSMESIARQGELILKLTEMINKLSIRVDGIATRTNGNKVGENSRGLRGTPHAQRNAS
ncbi:hypothetical protein QYF36_016292 [Acer negundo]|nr:hypothetical protein QYF36_016292 [Acer negundo]